MVAQPPPLPGRKACNCYCLGNTLSSLSLGKDVNSWAPLHSLLSVPGKLAGFLTPAPQTSISVREYRCPSQAGMVI